MSRLCLGSEPAQPYYHGNVPFNLKRKWVNLCPIKSEDQGEEIRDALDDDEAGDEELEIQWIINRVWKPVKDVTDDPNNDYNDMDVIKTLQSNLQMLYNSSAKKSTEVIDALKDGIKKLEDISKKENKMKTLENQRRKKEMFNLTQLTRTFKTIQNNFENLQSDKSDEITI